MIAMKIILDALMVCGGIGFFSWMISFVLHDGLPQSRCWRQ
jgi:hypothetical protein